MSWFDRLKALFRREVADVKEGLGNVGEALDEELARKERELAASPEERIDMILEENAEADANFQELEDKIKGDSAAVEEPSSKVDPD